MKALPVYLCADFQGSGLGKDAAPVLLALYVPDL